MKILFLTTVSLSINGVTEFISQYTEYEKDNQVDIVASMPSDASMKEELRRHCHQLYEFEHRKVSTLRYFLDLVRLIRKNNYDIVHAHGSSATLAIELFAAKVAGCPIRIAHSHNTQCENVKLDKILRPLFYFSKTHALACGQEAGEWLFPGRPFEVIPNGRSIERFKFNQNTRTTIRQQLGATEHILIGHVGVFYPQKNHQFIIDSFAELYQRNPLYKLVLIGYGPQFDEIQDYAVEKGIFEQIIFTGLVDNVQEYLSAMDLMILPSLFEGLPLVVVEWQINGLPTILSDRITRECQLTDLVSYLPIDNPRLWADKMAQFGQRYNDKSYYLSYASQVNNQGFDAKHTTEKLNAYYKKIREK